jgi:hypothetical protein
MEESLAVRNLQLTKEEAELLQAALQYVRMDDNIHGVNQNLIPRITTKLIGFLSGWGD